jgi:hypothetical protein
MEANSGGGGGGGVSYVIFCLWSAQERDFSYINMLKSYNILPPFS